MAKCHIDVIVIDFYDFEQICKISRAATQMFRPYRALKCHSAVNVEFSAPFFAPGTAGYRTTNNKIKSTKAILLNG